MISKRCGITLSSSCVFFHGKDFTFVKEEDQLKCDSTVSDAFDIVDKYLKKLVDGNDLTELTPNGLTFDPATITIKGLHQIEIDEISLLKAQVSALTTQLNNLNIGNEVINLNLSCLTPDAAPCAVGTDQYQLITILTLFLNKICDFETRISNLES